MRHEESAIQRAVCDHLSWRGVPGLVWTATANGGKRNAREAARMKAEGVRAGVADLLLWHDGKAYALELKTKKGRLSKAQENFLDDFCREANGLGFVVYGLDHALSILEELGL